MNATTHQHRTTWLTIALLMVGVALPTWGSASCLCSSGSSCKQATNVSSCCGAKASAKSCCPNKATAKQGCCCTDPLRLHRCQQLTSCGNAANQSLGCQCSSAPAESPSALTERSTPAPEKSSAQGEFLIWEPLCLTTDVGGFFPLDLTLHTPPIPVRELYCVWRK